MSVDYVGNGREHFMNRASVHSPDLRFCRQGSFCM